MDKVLDHVLSPQVIYCSPYLRTRQTCDLIVQELLDRGYSYPMIIYDPELSEFLGNQKTLIPDVTPETLQYGIYTSSETVDEFKSRVKKWFYKHKNEECC